MTFSTRLAAKTAVTVTALLFAWLGWAIAASAHAADTTTGTLTVPVPAQSAPANFELHYGEESISNDDIPILGDGATLTLAFSSHLTAVPNFTIDSCPGSRPGATIKLKGLPPGATFTATLENPGHATVTARIGHVAKNNADYHVVAKICQR